MFNNVVFTNMTDKIQVIIEDIEKQRIEYLELSKKIGGSVGLGLKDVSYGLFKAIEICKKHLGEE